LLIGALIIQSLVLAYVTLNPRIHVIDVMPEGQSTFVKDPLGHIEPRSVEVVYAVKRFVRGFWGWSGIDLVPDIEEALGLCEPALRKKLIEEVQLSKLIERSRKDLMGLWSRVDFIETSVSKRSDNGATVVVQANIERFHAGLAEDHPLETLSIALEVDVRYRRRSADFPSGTELVAIREKRQNFLGNAP
jgi:hypothetical protein